MGCTLCSGELGDSVFSSFPFHKQTSSRDTTTCTNMPRTTLTSIQPNPHEVDLSHFYFASESVCLGMGGFGLVRQIYHHTKNESYALKSLAKYDLLRRNNGVTSVYQELQVLQYLKFIRSPLRQFVCNVHYAFQDLRYVYLVMDLCTGGDLRYNLNNIPAHKYTESTAKFYISQVLLALNALHSVNILHRDCKPENIILCSNGYLKLGDFGVAKYLIDIECCRSTSGTHGYMAPEIYSPPNLHGTEAEWFAVGVTLYEFLIGHRPFSSARMQTFKDKFIPDMLETPHLHNTIGLTDQCKHFISKCLERFQKSRIGAMNGFDEILAHPWFTGYNWQGIMEQTVPPPFLPTGLPQFNSKEVSSAIHQHLNTPNISYLDQSHFDKFGHNHILTKETNGSTNRLNNNNKSRGFMMKTPPNMARQSSNKRLGAGDSSEIDHDESEDFDILARGSSSYSGGGSGSS